MLRNVTKYMLLGVKEKVKPFLGWLPMSWKRGSHYKHWMKFLKETRSWNREAIEQWQLQRLKEITAFAYNHTGGYRELYDQAKVHPRDIQTLGDLKHFPFVTKSLMQDNLEAFSVPGGLRFYMTTGGSTGVPFGFYLRYENSEIEDAFIHSIWSMVDWYPGKLNAILRGGHIGSEADFWKYDRFRHELLLSSYFLTSDTLERYVQLIRRFKPPVLQAYPSALNFLCNLLKDDNEAQAPEFETIILASENIYDWMMEKYEATFPKARFFSFYGHAEQSILASWCEYTRDYHIWPFYGFTELLDSNNEEAQEGQETELVGTGFHMKATPFIRYRTMDIAVKGPSFCDRCGRPYQLLTKIVGRSHEAVVITEGRCVSMTALNMHSDVFDHVRQFQFYQDKLGEVEFRIVKKPEYSESDTLKIHQELKKKLGDEIALRILVVEEIPRTRAGKYKYLEQKLPVDYLCRVNTPETGGSCG